MVKVSDCTCCDCESATEKEQIKERALSSINKIWTTDARTYYPDGTGMVTLPIPSAEQITQMEANTKLIKAHTANITVLDQEMEDVQGTVGKIPTGYTLYRDGEGKIRLQAEATDGSLINSNVLDMMIPYQYDLISGTTSRSFKLNIVMSNGSSYTTNDFVIPEGGGTDVTVTGIVLSKDQGDVNRFHVGINLSDSTMIDSGYIAMVDNVGAEYADGKLTISVNGVSSVPVAVDVTGEFSAGDGIKIESGTISISDELAERLTTIESDITNVLTVANRAFDAVTLADNVLTLERGNGGTESVTLPSGGDEWEELDLTNLPTDFSAGDMLKIFMCMRLDYLTPDSWNSIITSNALGFLTLLNNYPATIFTIQLKDTNNNNPHLALNMLTPSTACIVQTSLMNFGSTDKWNGSASEDLLAFKIIQYNANMLATNQLVINRDNISDYIFAIYRKKSS